MRAILLPPILLICAVVCVAEDKPKDKPKTEPKAKLPIGKTTTYVTGPLDKYGYIDYEAAINVELSKDITTEKNANALLIGVLGPAPEGGDGLPPVYFKWLGIPIPPKDGDYFIGESAYIHDKLGISGDQLDAIYDLQSKLTRRPWKPKDCPPLAEWLEVNEKQLTRVIEAVKRPQYFNPLVSRKEEGESSNLIGTLLPSVQKCRELATAFSIRATLRIQEGKYDDAWGDILACHRLGRLCGRGATLIEGLVGYAICAIAHNSTITYLAYADLTSKQVLEKMKELQSLPALPVMADKIDIGERFMGLDALQLIRRGGDFEGNNNKLTEEQRKAMASIDWTPTMEAFNKFYDRSSAAMRKDRATRDKELDKIEAELQEAKKQFMGTEDDLLKFVQQVSKEAEKGKPSKEVGKKIGDVLLSLLAPAVRKVLQAQDRTSQYDHNLQIAFALKAYHKDNSRYPTKLTELAPKYIAKIPDDLFSGKPLVYKPDEKGYLFYSVGVNGKDDDGRGYDDEPRGDDLRVKMPLPEPKKK